MHKQLILAAALVLASVAASAATPGVTVTGTTPAANGFNDVFTLNNGSITAASGTLSDFVVATYDFEVGATDPDFQSFDLNFVSQQGTSSSSSAGFTLSYGAQRETFFLPFEFSRVDGVDTAAFGTVSQTFNLGHQSYLFETKAFTVSGSDGDDVTGSLHASVSAVPEPASVSLMLAGLAALGFTARRRIRG